MFSLSIRGCKNKQQKYVSVLFLFYFLLIVKKNLITVELIMIQITLMKTHIIFLIIVELIMIQNSIRINLIIINKDNSFYH